LLGELCEGKLHAQFLRGGAGNGSRSKQIPRQSLTRQLFFRWIKMHLRIKAFYGTSENAVKTQIWIAVSVYVLVAIVRNRLGIEGSLYQILQILSLTLFEKTPILQALQEMGCDNDLDDICNQLNLFDL
jgi:hypothetical protein